MINVPIWVFVLYNVCVGGQILLIIWKIIAYKINKKEYYKYLEEEYGKNRQDHE